MLSLFITSWFCINLYFIFHFLFFYIEYVQLKIFNYKIKEIITYKEI